MENKYVDREKQKTKHLYIFLWQALLKLGDFLVSVWKIGGCKRNTRNTENCFFLYKCPRNYSLLSVDEVIGWAKKKVLSFSERNVKKEESQRLVPSLITH